MWKVPIDCTVKRNAEKNNLIKPTPVTKSVEPSNIQVDIGISIDRQGSLDLDDIFWIEQVGDTYYISIYIPDVTYYLRKNSIIDYEARKQLETDYYKSHNGVCTMLPSLFSNQYLRMTKGVVRKCLKFDFTYSDKKGSKLINISKCFAKNVKEYTYIEANGILSNPNMSNVYECVLDTAKNITHKMYLESKLKSKSKSKKCKVEDFCSENIIKELMVMCNEKIGDYFFKHDLVALYFTTETKPDRTTAYFTPHVVSNNKPYISITSPIRKYSDIINHRILKAHLSRKQNPYNKQEIVNMCNHSNSLLKNYIIPIDHIVSIKKQDKLSATSDITPDEVEQEDENLDIALKIKNNIKSHINKFIDKKIQFSMLLNNLQYKFNPVIRNISIKNEVNVLQETSEYNIIIVGSMFDEELYLNKKGYDLDKTKNECAKIMLDMILKKCD